MEDYSFKKYLEWRIKEGDAIWDGSGDTVDYQWLGAPESMGKPNQPCKSCCADCAKKKKKHKKKKK